MRYLLTVVAAFLAIQYSANAQPPNAAANSPMPPNSVAYVELRPSSLLEQMHENLLPTEVFDAVVHEAIGVRLSDLAQIRLILAPPAQNAPPFVGGILNFNNDIELFSSLKASSIAQGGNQIAEKTDASNRKLLILQTPQFPLVFHQLGPRQAVVGMGENVISGLLAKSFPAGPLARIVAEKRQQSLAQILVALEPVRPMLVAMANQNAANFQKSLPAEFHDVLLLPQWLDAVQIVTDYTQQGELLSKLTLTAIDAESAVQIRALAERAVITGKAYAEQSLAQPQLGFTPPVRQAALQYIDRLSKHLLEQSIPKPEGKDLTFQFRGTSNIATTGVLVGLLLPAVQAAREAARRMAGSNNLKQLSLALHNYHAAYGHFPASYSVDAQGKPLLSWRVHILPFIEHEPLYREFHLDEPWDSPHNQTLVKKMPESYLLPGSPNQGKSSYQAPKYEGGLWNDVSGTKLSDIRDGTSNTVMLLETDLERQVFWTRPVDAELTSTQPFQGLGKLRPGGFQCAFADGSVRFIAMSIQPDIWRGMLTSAGGD